MRKLIRVRRKYYKPRGRLGRRLLAGGTVAAITLGTAAKLSADTGGPPPDAHQLAVAKDADNDLLADREEYSIGYEPFRADQNRNGVPDGVELAERCAVVINNLPEYDFQAPPGLANPHKVRYITKGQESCDVCGLVMGMDHWDIVNPKLGLVVQLPVMAAHYMEHGSFSYAASYHNGRAHVASLLRAIELEYPHDPNEHVLAVDGNDLDADMLTDAEELACGYDLRDSDQDGDLLPDGIELARQCQEVFEALPEYIWEPGAVPPEVLYKERHWFRGLENCHICGKAVNMGYWLIVNPAIYTQMEVPDIACHYMGHGSFCYSGDVHGNGRLDVALLATILEIPRRCGDLGTLFLPGDLNKDCKEDFRDVAQFGQKWLESTDPNE